MDPLYAGNTPEPNAGPTTPSGSSSANGDTLDLGTAAAAVAAGRTLREQELADRLHDMTQERDQLAAALQGAGRRVEKLTDEQARVERVNAYAWGRVADLERNARNLQQFATEQLSHGNAGAAAGQLAQASQNSTVATELRRVLDLLS